MKKSSAVLLTIMAALGISSCAVQKTADNSEPRDPVYSEQLPDDNNRRYDSTQYVYRSYYWDGVYRRWFPQRYYRIVTAPGYVPRNLRTGPRPSRMGIARVSTHRSGPRSTRGGFGHHGSFNSVVG